MYEGICLSIYIFIYLSFMYEDIYLFIFYVKYVDMCWCVVHRGIDVNFTFTINF